MNPETPGFDGVCLFGDVPPPLAAVVSRAVAAPTLPVRPVHGTGSALAAIPLDEGGRVGVDDLVAAAREAHPTRGRLLVVSAADLVIPELDSLFGFADRRRNVAVVSIARLGEPAGGHTAARLLNAIAHEAGHLDGLGHCSHEGCLMQRITSVEQMDHRGDQACGRCPRMMPLWRRAAAAAALLALLVTGVFSLDAAGTAVFGPDLEVVFTCRAMDAAGAALTEGSGAGDSAVFHFEGRPLFAIHDKGGRANILDRSRPMMHQLNELWRAGEPIVLDAYRGDSSLVANGLRLMDVRPGDRRGRSDAAVVEEWAGSIASLFRAHGREVSIRAHPGAAPEWPRAAPHHEAHR